MTELKKLTKYYKVTYRDKDGYVLYWNTWSDDKCTEALKIINIILANDGVILGVNLVEDGDEG